MAFSCSSRNNTASLELSISFLALSLQDRAWMLTMGNHFEHDSLIGEYRHERHRSREADALQTLRRVASIVKPIMRQRGWRVGVLTEFFPAEGNLYGLNWNHGEKICLRLRHAGDDRQFLPLEVVVDTMLHELVHIVIGPHNDDFHKLWNQLRDEHESLTLRGYTGEGFLSPGQKLGGSRVPRHEVQRRAHAAAVQRQTLSAGSGQKLGGKPVRRGQDMRKVIADAATRRINITKGCANEGMTKKREREIVESTDKNNARTEAGTDDADEEAIMLAYIDLIQEEEREKYGSSYVPPSRENPLGSRGAPIPIPSSDNDRSCPGNPSARRPPNVPTATKPPPPSSSSTSSPFPSEPIHLDPDTWTCTICTLVNPLTYLCCDACGTERPFSPPSQPNSNTHNRNPHFPTTPTTNSVTHSSAIRDGNATKAVRSLINLDRSSAAAEAQAARARKGPKPMGWLCHACGNWMEQEWWTCANCGRMKLSS